MKAEDKKAARAAYKERKSIAGVYALRCSATGEVWVGQARDVEKIWNRISFTLSSGGAMRPSGSAQSGPEAAWKAHGETAFALEVLERLDEETFDFALRSTLDERAAFWREKLAAAPI